MLLRYFSSWSSLFFNIFPVKKEERKKFFLLCLLKWLFSLVFTMLKLQKSNNVVTAHGAEAVAYVKSFVFPATLVFIGLYTVFATRFSQRTLLYGIIVSFLLIFGLYGFVLLPYKEVLTPDIAGWEASWAHYPTLVSFLRVYKHWIQVFFFCFAELFGQFFIILFFWGIANEVFNREQAKRLYHLLIAAGCLGSMLGSQLLKLITYRVEMGYASRAAVRMYRAEILDEVSRIIAFWVLGVLLIVLFVYRWILKQGSMLSGERVVGTGSKMSFFRALRYIGSRPYLMATTLIIISCALSSSLVEITYQKYIKYVSNSEPSAYANWTANQLFMSDVLCIVAGFFLTHRISRRFSWQVNSYITPLVFMCFGGLFFVVSSLNYTYGLDGFSKGLLGMKASRMIAWVGLVQAILGVFARYVFFDSTKEIIFISLGPEVRRKSKGAVDVVGSRFGKGLSAYIHVGVLWLFELNTKLPPVERVSHVLLAIFLVFCLLWLGSIRYLAPKVDGRKASKN